MNRRVLNPKVSVVIPTFNRARALRRALDSLKVQTVSDFEVLICDDGSTDETEEVAKEYSRFLDLTYDRGHHFGGPARPRNRGIARSRAPFIAFLDSDDWWSRRKLEVSLRRLAQGPDIVYHDLWVVTNEQQRYFWQKKRTRSLRIPVFRDLVLNGNAINTSSVVASRRILEKIAGFSEEPSLIGFEDYDAWIRAARFSDGFARISLPLGFYWAGGGNISNFEDTLSLLTVWEERYREEFKETVQTAPDWLLYTRGRICFLSERPECAKRNLRQIGWRSPLPILVRSLIMLLALCFRRDRGSSTKRSD